MSRQMPPNLNKFCSFAVSFVPPARRSQRQDGSRSCWICNSSCNIYFWGGFFLDFPPIGTVQNRIATPCTWFHSYNNVFIFFLPCSVDIVATTTILNFFFPIMIFWLLDHDFFLWFVPCLDVSLIFFFSFHVFMLAFFFIFVLCHDVGFYFFPIFAKIIITLVCCD